jgi:hypothetical protein
MNSDAASQQQANHCVVAGTSVGGLTAATLLAEQGISVTLLTGGEDPASDRDPGVETLAVQGGDLLMGCHGHLHALHERLGLAGQIRWSRQLDWLNRAGRVDTLAGDDLPAPLHMLRSLLGLSLFSPGQRITLLRGMLALIQVSSGARARLRGMSLAQWLGEHRQSPALIERFWSPLSRLACDAPADHVPAGEAIHVLQRGLLHHESTYHLGWSQLTHGDLIGAVQQRVEAAGGQMLRTGGLRQIECERGCVVRLRLADGQEVPVNQAILAMGPGMLAEAGADLASQDRRFTQLHGLEPVPRMDIDICFNAPAGTDRSPFEGNHLITPESAISLLVQREAGCSHVDGGETIQAVLACAGDWIDRDSQQVSGDVAAELNRLMPTIGERELTVRRVDRRPRLSYGRPIDAGGTRPAMTGDMDNLELAGGWCATDLPPGLEGSAAAGTAAAQRVLARLGRESSAIEPPASEPGLLYRLLSG